MGFSNNFASNGDADLADPVQFGVESAGVDLVCIDGGAESDSGCVNLPFCQLVNLKMEQTRWLTISWVMWIALQRIAPRPMPGKTYILLFKSAFIPKLI